MKYPILNILQKIIRLMKKQEIVINSQEKTVNGHRHIGNPYVGIKRQDSKITITIIKHL